MNDIENKDEVRFGPGELRGRDAGMVRLMGVFFVGFALLVLLGQFWPQGWPERVVNGVAGVALLVTGVGAIVVSARLNRPPP